MRIRTIKPEFWSHPILSKIGDSERLAAIGLLNIADDEGFFLAEPALIRSQLWPFDESSTNVRRILDELSRIGYVEVRNHPTHGPVGVVVNFCKHQRIDRPSASKIKGYFLDESSTNPRRILDERSLLEQGTGNREQGTGNKGGVATAPVAVAPAPSEDALKPARLRFTPPTLEQVKLQASKIGLPDPDAIAFHSYYESNGWKVGKNPMRSWTAAMTTWKIKRDTNGYHRGRTEQVADDRNRFISDTRSDADKAADEAAFQARQRAWLAANQVD